MNETIIGTLIGLAICIIVSPYFSLWHLKSIAEELENIREILEKKGKEK